MAEDPGVGTLSAVIEAMRQLFNFVQDTAKSIVDTGANIARIYLYMSWRKNSMGARAKHGRAVQAASIGKAKTERAAFHTPKVRSATVRPPMKVLRRASAEKSGMFSQSLVTTARDERAYAEPYIALIQAITGADEGDLPNRRGASAARLDKEGDAQAGSSEEQGRNKNRARGPHARAQGSISHARLLNRTIGEHHVKPLNCEIMRKLRVVA